MVRRSVFGLFAFLLFGLVVTAAEYKGTIEKIDTKSGAMTVKVDDKPKSFDITYMAKIYDASGKESTGKKRLAVIAKDASVTVTTETQKVGGEDKEVVTKVQINK